LTAELRSLSRTESPDLVEALLLMSQRVAVLEKQASQSASDDRPRVESKEPPKLASKDEVEQVCWIFPARKPITGKGIGNIQSVSAHWI
jgi:hypothetical protein